MVRWFLLLAVLTVPGCSNASAQQSTDMNPCPHTENAYPIERGDSSFAAFDHELRAALIRQDAAAMSFLVKFPLRVNTDAGTILIPDAASLSGHFNDIFPTPVRDQILNTKAVDYVCRYDEGIGYKAGVIWVDVAKDNFSLTAVNVDTSVGSPEPSLRFTCETDHHRIAIDEWPHGVLRYRSWNKPKPLTEKPDLELSGGKLIFQGTGICSTGEYEFESGNTVYDVSDGLGCTDGSEPKDSIGDLTISISGKEIVHAWCY